MATRGISCYLIFRNRFIKIVAQILLKCGKVAAMFFESKQRVVADSANAVMSQHVAQQSAGERGRALMSQHVAQQCTGECAQAIMSQHVAQQCGGESARALMSQHVAQQSLTFGKYISTFARLQVS